MITTILIPLIISIQKTSSFPTFVDQLAIEPMKEYLSKGVSALNVVNMEIVDEVASNMDKFPLMKESNATEHFKRIIYPNLQFPEKIEDQLEHNIDDLTNTFKSYQNSMIKAISKNNKDTKTDNGNEDATNENDSTADDNNDSKKTQPNEEDFSKSVKSYVNGSSTDGNKNAENSQPNNGKNREATDKSSDTSKNSNKKAEDVKT